MNTEKKIAHLVKNSCNPDWRVIKTAEQNAKIPNSLVYIFGVLDQDSLPFEEKNNVFFKRLYQKFRFDTPIKERDLSRNMVADLFFAPVIFFEFALYKLKLIKEYSPRMISFIREKRKIFRLFFDEIVAFKPDIVHCHDLATLQLGIEIKRKLGCKVIYDAHEFESNKNPPSGPLSNFLIKRHEGKYIKKADKVVTVSQEISKELLHIHKLKEKPLVIYNVPHKDLLDPLNDESITLYNEKNEKKTSNNISINNIINFSRNSEGIFNWILENIFSLNNHKIEKFRSLIDENYKTQNLEDLKEYDYVGVYVGLVTVGRGIETCIKAISNLQNHAFVIIGPRRNESFLRELLELIYKLNIRERIFIIDPLYCGLLEFIGKFNYSAVSTLPNSKSTDFSMPNKLFESILSNLPIVCSDTTSASNYVNDRNLGISFLSDNHFDLASKIKTLMERQEDFFTPNQMDLIEELSLENQYKSLNNYLLSLDKN